MSEVKSHSHNLQTGFPRGLPRGLESQSYEGDKRIFYFFYFINDKIVIDPYNAKFETTKSLLFNKRSNAALVVIFTENEKPNSQGEPMDVINFIHYSCPIILKMLSNIV